ncbi:MAG: cytidylate kinase family protein [Candidatus Thermoplasmatota archaeon]|nr:cytidylate kinase family protein [Candidatus Thermoplasmatota archaeon]
MLLTISGEIGSGKSTIARLASTKLGYSYVSGGDIFRDLAKEKGMTVDEFGALAEKEENIDRDLDRLLLDTLRKNRNMVVDSRLSGWLCFINDINALKVFVKAPLDIRVKRVMFRENLPEKTVRAEIRAREQSEMKRYKQYYDIDYSRTDIYNLIIDSGSRSAQEIADELYDRISPGGKK